MPFAMLLRLLALLFSALLSQGAAASVWTYTNSGWPSSPYTAASAESLCAIIAAEASQLNASGNPPNYTPPPVSGVTVVGMAGMEPNRTALCQFDINWAQGDPYVDVELQMSEASGSSGGSCTASEANSETHNVTIGWGRSPVPDASDLVGAPFEIPYADGIAVGGCMRAIDKVKRCWRSQEPSPQGLYRVSCDLGSHTTGVSAPSGTTTTAQADPNASNMACPGYVGEVNGRTQCVGTQAQPLPTQAGAVPPTSQEPGNPAAGPKPSTGQGSGDTGQSRTPTTGNGGNAGGGSSAAIPAPGTNGSTVSANVEVNVETCGRPGQPPCKIDEAGTPDGTGLNGANTAITTAGNALKDAVSNVDKPSSFGWSFGIALPEGACSALQFYKPGGTWGVDVCNSWIIDLMRSLIAWGFAAFTALYVWRKVTAAAGGEGG